MTPVEYRDLPGFPGYRIGSDGSVWSCRTFQGRLGGRWHQRTPILNKHGRFQLLIHPGRLTRHVHRLVLEAFVGPCPDGLECCHNDGDRTNNALSNLRWDTRRSNRDDMVRHGRTPQGTRHPSAKATEDIARQILSEYAAGGVTQKQLAAKHKLSKATVGRIVTRKRWRHVTPDTQLEAGS